MKRVPAFRATLRKRAATAVNILCAEVKIADGQFLGKRFIWHRELFGPLPVL